MFFYQIKILGFEILKFFHCVLGHVLVRDYCNYELGDWVVQMLFVKFRATAASSELFPPKPHQNSY